MRKNSLKAPGVFLLRPELFWKGKVMLTLFTDLDNTLIYSHRQLKDVSRYVPIEFINDRVQSYINKKTLAYLNSAISQGIQIVPVTTRNLEQYSRLQLPKFEYAILDNGGKLLHNNEDNLVWEMNSCRAAKDCVKEFRKSIQLLKKFDLTEYKYYDNRMLMVKSVYKDGLFDLLNSKLDTKKVSILHHGTKFYIAPVSYNKGLAVCRLKQILDVRDCISAGDSSIDFPMATYTDMFLTSNELCTENNTVLLRDGVFSNGIFEYIFSLFK